MRGSRNAGWAAMTARGFTELSPPEAEHAMLELPTERAEYVGVLELIADYPARSPIGARIPTDAEVRALTRGDGGWRAVALLDDERALKAAACSFGRVFVLDPFYDIGAMLYAAWHDPTINEDYSRRIAEQTALLVKAAPLLNAGTAVLAPDHLPGSWNPRPGWRKPRRTEDRRQVAGWSMRTSLVLLYWADRLDALVCAAQPDIVAALESALGVAANCLLELPEPDAVNEAQHGRETSSAELRHRWRECRRFSRRRARRCLDEVAFTLENIGELTGGARSKATWRLALGRSWLPEPPMLITRVLHGQHTDCGPTLPRRELSRPPLCLLAGSP